MTLRDTVGKFLVPEPTLSLKLFFDNIRNYLIVGAFLAASTWLSQGAPNAPSYAIGNKFASIAPTLSAVVALIGALLALLNFAQTLRLSELLVVPALNRFIDASYEASKMSHPLVRRVKLALLMQLFVLVSVSLLFLGFALVLALIYVVVFGAASRAAA